MLAQASATVARPSRVIVAALVAPEHAWTIGLDDDGGSLLARVGLVIAKIPVYKEVRLHIGASTIASSEERAMLPVSWEAVGGPPIFPKMEGTLHVEPDGPGAAKVTLNARYDPPLGGLGQLIDRVAMHRMAQITMTNFVQRLAAALAAETAAG